MNNNIQILRASESMVSENEYLDSIKTLITETQKEDPTVVLHSDEEIIEKFKDSIIAIINGEIVWNTSIYETNMEPLNEVYKDWKKVKIWECGSTFIKKEYRKLWLWKQLVKTWLKEIGPDFWALLWATVNNIMFNLRCSLWFEEIPFPKKYYEEGRQYLWTKMKWWIEEFEQRAKCTMHFQNTTKEVREHISNILLNQ